MRSFPPLVALLALVFCPTSAGQAQAGDLEPQLAPSGGRWQLIAQPNPGIITDFALAPDDPDDFYMATNPDGAWQSQDGGATDLSWRYLGMGQNYPGDFDIHITRVAVAPGNSQQRYGLNIGGSMARTSDGGLTMTAAKKQSLSGKPWTALAVSPIDDQRVLVGGENQLRWSDDAGDDWDTATGDFTGVIVTDIEYVPDSATGMVAWASTTHCVEGEPALDCAAAFTDGKGVFYSTDDGLTWTRKSISTAPGDPRNLVNNLATVPGQDGSVIAATDDGLWVSVDFGDTWADQTPPGLAGRRINDVVYASQPLRTMYVATNDGGVLRGDLSGPSVSWLRTSFPMGVEYTALDTTLDSANRLYVGTHDGDVYSTDDYGTTVVTLEGAHGGYPMVTLGIHPTDETRMYVGTMCQRGLLIGDVPDPGHPTWTEAEKPSGDHFHYLMRIVPDPTDPNTIYVTDRVWFYRSTDGGVAWQSVIPVDNDGVDEDDDGSDDDDNVHLHGLAIAPSMPSRLYVGNGHGNWGAHTDPLRMWRSDDGGDTWIDLSEGLEDGAEDGEGEMSLYDIAVAPNDPDVVYAGMFGHESHPGLDDAEGVLRSLDAGVTWEQINDGLASDDAHYVGRIQMTVVNDVLYTYIATLDGLYRMVGAAGSTWEDISVSPTERRFESIAIDPSDPDVLYAGTSEPLMSTTPARIFRSLDGGASWSGMPIVMEPQAYAQQYRVRDIGVGFTRAYCVVEGSGIYMLEKDKGIAPRPHVVKPYRR